MHEKGYNNEYSWPVKVIMDERPVNLPPRCMKSVALIKTELEILAIRRKRVLARLLIDGVEVDMSAPTHVADDFSTVEAETVGFNDFRNDLILIARRRILKLQLELDRLVPLVLINDWLHAETLVHDWLVGFRNVIVLVAFLPELIEDEAMDKERLSMFLTRHAGSWKAVVAELSDVLEDKDTEELSDFLALELSKWVGELVGYLDSLHADLNS
ncbi:MAG: hypothetical protein K9N48_01290 [Verrucomicrobia bacterium]|nr:hypothetical protein [Verrucomicrobiota bacterium]MCF7707286.1 hypothetical protein [Verrucomicrobiota bacterium]